MRQSINLSYQKYFGENMSNKILVTGGAGYIGSALLPALAQLESVSEVLIYDNLSHGRREAFLQSPFEGSSKISFFAGEMLDTRTLKKAMTDVDYVIHLAAKVSTPFAHGDAHSFEQINHWGSAELSYIAEDLDIKGLLYVSSASVYGSSDEICTVETNPNPRSWYGKSKLRGEKMLTRLNQKFPVTVLRCANVYGLAPCVRFDAVINRFAFESHFVRRLMIEGNGKQKRAFVHIQNIANTIAGITDQTLRGSKTWNDVYNVVQHNTSIVDVAYTLKDIYNDLEMIFVEQDMPRHSLLVSSSEEINSFFHNRTLQDELQEMLNSFSF